LPGVAAKLHNPRGLIWLRPNPSSKEDKNAVFIKVILRKGFDHVSVT